MTKLLVALLLLTVAVDSSQAGRKTSTPGYVVPEPLVEPLKPKGLRVSIPDSPGLRLFAFHGSINQPLIGLAAGQMSKDVLTVEDDRWTFYDPDVKLKVGDVIYFWLFVQKDRLGYRRDDQTFIVTDLVDNTENLHDDTLQIQTPVYHSLPPETITPSCDPKEMRMLYIQVNHTKGELKILENDVKRLTKELENLREIQTELLRDLNTTDNNMLLLSGKVSKNQDPIMIIKSIISEKLLLSEDDVCVNDATRLESGSIWFTVESFEQKLKVLAKARSKLATSKLKIESYVSDQVPPRIDTIMHTEAITSATIKSPT